MDIGVCNRGWGVYDTEEVCCAPGVAFSQGCLSAAPQTMNDTAINVIEPPAVDPDLSAKPTAAALLRRATSNGDGARPIVLANGMP